MKVPGSIIAACMFGYLVALVSVVTWRLATSGLMPPLWLHLPLVIAAGFWAWWRWEKRSLLEGSDDYA